jgi:hypothetical protein
MSYLASLKLVQSNRSVQLPPVQYRRIKLINKLREQIDCVKARIEGRDHLITMQRSVKNTETGTRQYVQVPYRIRPWWYLDTASEKFHLELRYGSKRLELVKGKTGIEVESLEKMTEVLEGLVDAVNAGELDGCLEKTAKTTNLKVKK